MTAQRATLSGVVAFLVAQVGYMCDEPTFSLEQFADNIRTAHGALRALDATRERKGWGIPCPADYDDDVCGRVLKLPRTEDDRLDHRADLYCPRCESRWTGMRLLQVALWDERVTVWAYPGEVEAALDIPRRTLRHWATLGAVRRKGGRYDAGAAFRARHRRLEA